MPDTIVCFFRRRSLHRGRNWQRKTARGPPTALPRNPFVYLVADCVGSRQRGHVTRSHAPVAMADDTLDELQRLRQDRVRLGGPSADDTYGTAALDRGAYVDSLDVGDAPMEEEEYRGAEDAVARRLASYTAPKSVLDEVPRGQVDDAEQARAFPALAPLQRRFPPLFGLGLVSPPQRARV